MFEQAKCGGDDEIRFRSDRSQYECFVILRSDVIFTEGSARWT